MTADTRTNLEKLMSNAGVRKPEQIQAYLIGMDGLYQRSNAPEWMFTYAVDRRSDPAWVHRVRHAQYDFAIPWGDQTRGILQRILATCTERHLRWCAAWGLDALDEWDQIRSDAAAAPSPGAESNG